MLTLFWLSIALIVYSYFVYPLLLIVISGLKQVLRDTSYLFQRRQRRSQQTEDLPAVSIIIAAFNEEDCIGERVENLKTLDYPKDKLTIHIGSDGSSDATNEILKEFEFDGFNAHIFEQNRGKMSVLNDLCQLAPNDILVMSDANTHFQADAIRQLVRHFDDESVGAVCGELKLVDAETGDNKDGVYWRYEQVLKFHESRLNALLGANGAIYAMRKSLFKPLPANTIVDDYQIVMNIAKAGYQTKYDPEAVAIEEVAPNLQEEEGRRVRIGLGNYQAFFAMPWALNPFQGFRFLSYVSHKVLRWFVPHMMLIAIVTNIFLATTPLYQVLLAGQVGFYLIAWHGIRKQKANKPVNGGIALIAFFVSMNVALMRGFFRYFNSNVQGTWQRTKR